MSLGTGLIRTFRILALALMGALFVIGGAIPPALASKRNQVPNPTGAMPLWPYIVVLGLGASMVVTIAAAGYRAPALPSGVAAPRAQVVATFRQLFFLRFALANSVAIISIALTFAVRPTSFTIYLLGAAIALALMGVHVWPSQRIVDKVQAVLDRDGGHSDLSAVLFASAQ
jgi:hypothetical protein